MEISPPKNAEHTPPPSASATAPQPLTVHPYIMEPSPPSSQAGPKVSTSADTPVDATSPPFSPSSTTPVLEKDDLDFAGNVDVNDELPDEKTMKKVDDTLVLDANRVSRPFSDLYRGPGVAPRQLIIFIRHFFCGNCQEYLRTLSSSITPESLLKLDAPASITVVGCGEPELIDMYAKETNCPFPIYAEPTRRLYDLLGMTKTWDLGPKPNYIHSNIIITSLQSIGQSLKTGSKALKGGDFKQVGGEFLFEDGKCTWVHRMRNTRDHCEVTDVRRMLGLDDARPPMRKRWSHGIKQVKARNRSRSWGLRSRSRSKTAKDERELVKETEEKMNLNGSTTA
ncbi:AhpC/TSA antioxidant enzyme-domain-containing protein [Lophiotrema nucula]|uniref:AhpC/TSA antioxidant enzyme-domain-containing protein n=1 Tax=Lophiotrema nucula TaxID=690887 RepID=A0A6A5ZUY4_9PLEO|nr:AhpC/TSA antioxidant enzyme-domain-containing protein [Lophiotrema nucula]